MPDTPLDEAREPLLSTILSVVPMNKQTEVWEAVKALEALAKAEAVEPLACKAMMFDGTQCDFPRDHDSPHISVEQIRDFIAAFDHAAEARHALSTED